ncbi:transposable element Tcb1 transposase [Trichonephila clavipes]|nr:transposable element Tcb1 transposase [Trichonephila clavipes]
MHMEKKKQQKNIIFNFPKGRRARLKHTSKLEGQIYGNQREIGSRVGRNQTPVMWICDRWMQEGTKDRRGRSHPPQCTTSREDRKIVRTSRTIAQHIESVTYPSVTTDVSVANGAIKEGCGRQNGMKLSLLTSRASVCNTTMIGFESGGTVKRGLNSCVMHRPTGPAPANVWPMVAQRLSQITPPPATPDQLWQCVEAAWSAVPQEHIQSLFESMPRRVSEDLQQ